MIVYLKRDDINIEKYDACIENAIQSSIYAFSWYLDIVAENWDVLVLNDYEAVMPLPWKRKYFIKYITQPFFCQQLGVFYKNETSEELIARFINKIPKRFRKVNLNFNSDNFSLSEMESKINYILELNLAYKLLFKNFSKGRKHAVKVGEGNSLKMKKCSILDIIKIKKEFYNHSNFPQNILKELVDYILKNNKGYIRGVYSNEVLLGGGFFLKSKNRITYLFSSFNKDGRKQQAGSFLIASIIKQNENSQFILDFEGSNIPSIASFFKSFGAKTANYHRLSYKNFPFIL